MGNWGKGKQSAFACGHTALCTRAGAGILACLLHWGGRSRPPQPNPQGPAATLASSISILDLARRSLRSKSRCFCSRSASRSVTCFCRSASFWRSSVIWVQRQREGVRERDCPRDDTAEQDGGGGDALTTAENLGSALASRNSHTTFCSYCCFMDRKCWSHCLFTSSSCGERAGLAGDKQRTTDSQLLAHQLPSSAQCVRTLATDAASISCFSIKLSAPQRESLYQPPHFILPGQRD